MSVCVLVPAVQCCSTADRSVDGQHCVGDVIVPMNALDFSIFLNWRLIGT